MSNHAEQHERWERQPRETSRAYELFCAYRDMGIERSLRKMKASLNGSPSVRRLQVLSARWNWVERSQAYDDYLEYQRRLQQEKERREMNDRHAKIAILGQNVAVKGIEQLLANVQTGQQNLNPSELARLVDVSVKVERLARGESTDIHESVGPGGGPVQLTIQNVADRAREAIEESLGITNRGPDERVEAEEAADISTLPNPLGE